VTETPGAAAELPELSEEHRRLRDDLLAKAEEYGMAIVEVAGDEEGAPYSFSVGAWHRYRVPEAVVIGMPAGLAARMLHAYLDRALDGETVVLGRVYEDFYDGVPVVFERVARGHYFEYFGSAFLLYRRGDFSALQLLVPTSDGIWPWSPDAPAGFAAWQPVLTPSGDPESWTPGLDGP